MNLVPGKKPVSQYLRIIRDGFLPGRQIFCEMVFILTTKCTLRCENCNNLMPCYKQPYNIPSDTIISDIYSFLNQIDTCVKLSLLGGEPFVYPDLGKVIDEFVDNKKIMYLSMTTNATIIPKEEILKRLEHKKVVVHISDYDLPMQKVDELIAVFKKRGIKYTHKKDVDWVIPGPVTKRGKEIGQLKKEYESCYSSRYCRTVLNGKAYLCARGAHLTDLGYMDEPHDCFDMRKKRTKAEFRKEFRKFYLSDYAMACDHCDHALNISVRAGVQKTGQEEQ
ncbi:MAG: radical SAM protein [Lachnospiraceae bacterium]|nr:radical SAM protein [Lachnospiraceae bacterium]